MKPGGNLADAREKSRKQKQLNARDDCCILKFLHFLFVLGQPQGCGEGGSLNSQRISASSNLSSFQIRTRGEVLETICSDKGTSLLFIHLLLCRCCVLFLERVQDCLCALSWLLDAGPWAPCWRRVQRWELEGQGEEEEERAPKVKHRGLLGKAEGSPGARNRIASQAWCSCRIATTVEAAECYWEKPRRRGFTLRACCLGEKGEFAVGF